MSFTLRPYRRFPEQYSVAHKAGMFLKLPLGYIPGCWLLVTLLVLSVRPLYAKWVSVGETQADITVYADPDTIRRKGDLVQMWQLSDFRTVQTVGGDSYFSSKALNEYDCAEERTRVLAFTWFSDNMGSGHVVYSNSNERNWEPVAPHSINEALWEVACSKK
jgi:surface-adhesin protein E